jgi:hypothetical protein
MNSELSKYNTEKEILLKEKTNKIAKSLKNENISLEIISKTTGLSISEIIEL